jgi:hypothetical protein
MSARLVLSICVAILLSAGIGPAKGDLQDGLVSHYKLDDGSGLIATDSVGENHGVLSDDVGLMWGPGYDGGALVNTAVDPASRVEIPTTGMSATAGTVTMWGYLTDPQPALPGRYFFGHTTQPQWANRIQIYMQIPNTDSDSRLLDIGLGDAHERDTDIMELPMKEWLHVALTWDNGAYVVYVDGEEVSRGTYTGLSDLHPYANIGNDGSLGPDASSVPYEPFAGILDEVRIYDRAILADEVKEIVELPAFPLATAWAPNPPDGDVTVMTPLFQWKAAPTARLHEVYLGTDPNLGPDDLVQPRSPMVLYYHPPGLIPGTTYYWRVDEIEADMTTVHTGKVWTFTARPYTAYVPDPADGANDASPDPNLTLAWGAGIGAAEHHLYFGGSLDDVNDGAADTDKGTLTETTFVLAEPLEPLTTYYWRVDEIGVGGTLQAGAVWSFTTFSAVEDFESYTDDIDAGEAIFQTWMDGFENGTGSTAGYFESANGTFNETTIVNSGGQSMPLDYNNVISPYYSEVERTWTVPQDWAVNGVDALVLYVRGSSDNGVEPLYVAVADSASRLGVAVHPDPAIVTTRDWAKWEVPLSEFTAAGVNLTAVTKMIIGAGDRDAPTPGGAGLVYIDDIRLTRP